MWSMYMEPHDGSSVAASFKVCAYADDLLIMIEGDSRLELENRGEQAMQIVQAWSDRLEWRWLPRRRC